MSDTSTLISALENAVLPLDFIYRARADESCFEISGHLFNLKLNAHCCPFLTIRLKSFMANCIASNLFAMKSIAGSGCHASDYRRPPG